MRKIVIPALATVLVVAAMLYQAKTVDPVLCDLPAVELGEIVGYASEEVPVSESETTVLPADTQFLKRMYTAEDGNYFQVSIVLGGKSKNSVHRPELCLPSQGFQMMNPHEIEVGDVDWHRVSLMRKDAPGMSFGYTFFNQAGFRTSSHMRRIFQDVWDRSILGRIDRWVMITVYSSVTDEQEFAAFLAKLRGVIR